MIIQALNVYKVNTPVRIRYFSKDYVSGLTDLKFVATSPSGVSSSPVYMNEIEPGLYETVFIPTSIGHWHIRISSILSIQDVESRVFFVALSYNSNQYEEVVKNIYCIEDNSESSTTSSSLISKLLWQFEPIITGKYILDWYFELTNSLASSDYYFLVRHNDRKIFTGRLESGISYSNNGWRPFSGFCEVYLDKPIEEFEIQYCRDSGTVYIKNARLKLTRCD